MASRPTATIPMIVDVDTGIDDALALLYACASPEVELLAVTCVSGNVHVDHAARNSMAMLDLGGRSDVEVARGEETPLRRSLSFYEYVHGPSGLGNAVVSELTRSLSERHAADLIIERAAERPGEITLVTLGPMTNLALAIEREPRLPGMLRRLVFMGGAYRWPGNVSPVAEANISMDPEAAERVFASFGASATAERPVAVGLDVTEQVLLTPAQLDAICGAKEGSPLAAFLRDAVPYYFAYYATSRGFDGAAMHDPLALAAAVDPTLLRTTPVAVQVEVDGTHTTGQTVADWRGVWEREPNVDVAVGVEGAVFLDRFVQRLTGLVSAST
jgi:purine nucleosidase